MTREPTEMELRVLSAIVKAEIDWLRQAGDAQEGLAAEVDEPLPLTLARAAIRAMREPATEFLDALAATDKMWRELNSKIVWQTFIDAASPLDDDSKN